MRSYDDIEPHTQITCPLCVFCSSSHTQKDLLNWQMSHLKDIPTKHHVLVIKHYYFYMDNEIKKIYTLIEDINRKISEREERKDDR